MVRVRDATPADAAAIAAVSVESWRVAYRGLMPEQMLAQLSQRERERAWTEWLTAPDAAGVVAVLVAVDDDPVHDNSPDMPDGMLGFAAVGAGREGDPLIGELFAIYLRPAVWGRGFGTIMHDTALDRLRAAGFARAGLWMLAGNRRALRFYHRHGWFADGRSRTVAGPGGDPQEHRGMSRWLAAPAVIETC